MDSLPVPSYILFNGNLFSFPRANDFPEIFLHDDLWFSESDASFFVLLILHQI